MNDLRFALRLLRKSPVFTAVAVLTLALGIGANTVVFSAVNTLLFIPLPFPEAHRLCRIYRVSPHSATWPHSPADFGDHREQCPGLQGVAAFMWTSFNVGNPGQLPERVQGFRVSADFFSVLGLPPEHGRSFVAGEDQLGNDQVVVLSHRFWQRRYGGQTNLVGQTIRVNGRPLTVVGIMPARFGQVREWSRVGLCQPLGLAPEQWRERGGRYLHEIARLKPGVSREQAEAELKALAARQALDYPHNKGESLRLVDLKTSLQGAVDTSMSAFVTAIALCVLLLGCANLANLQMLRLANRQREVAIRAALGASRARLLAHAVAESLVLVFMGSVAGVLLAGTLNDLLQAWINPYLVAAGHAPLQFQIDWRVLLSTAMISVMAVVLCGLLPAMQALPAQPSVVLQTAGRTVTTGRAPLRWRSWLIASEAGLAVVLLVCSALFTRGLSRTLTRDHGFRTEQLAVGLVSLSGPRYKDPQSLCEFYEKLVARVEAEPGVACAGLGTALPIWPSGMSRSFAVEAVGRPDPGRFPLAMVERASPSFFKAMGIPLLDGRAFTAHDRASAMPVVVVNQSLARAFWPGQSAVGKRITRGDPLRDDWATIVGVVADLTPVTQYQRPDTPYLVYEPLMQQPDKSAWLALRTTGRPEQFLDVLRRSVAALDPDIPASSVSTADWLIATELVAFRAAARFLAAFSVLGLVLAGVGIYGVISYVVAQRTNEIGIRMALGAQPAEVLRMILRQGLKPVGAGLGVGLVAALAAAHLARSLFFGLSPTDPLTLSLTLLILLSIAALACYLPARRVMRVDPMTALRYQ